MIDNAGSYYMLDGVMSETISMPEIDGSKTKIVYEIIRIVDRVPLFLEDHMVRMLHSAQSIQLAMQWDLSDIKKDIVWVLDKNHLTHCNIKVMIFSLEGMLHRMLYISKSYYPSSEEVEKGLPVSLVAWERHNPNAKIINTTYKEQVSNKIKEDGVFEVLLVNGNQTITEGSRSNVFFVKNGKVVTAPGEQVLRGITRQYILNACQNLNIPIEERALQVEELEEIEGLWISGTSIKVQPISSIGSRSYSSGTHPVIMAIRDEFNRIVEEYIRSHP